MGTKLKIATGTLANSKKFVPKKKCSLKKKGLDFGSVSDFVIFVLKSSVP